jgi:hypothetical protein
VNFFPPFLRFMESQDDPIRIVVEWMLENCFGFHEATMKSPVQKVADLRVDMMMRRRIQVCLKAITSTVVTGT